MAADTSVNHEYIPVTGLEAFTKASTVLLLGEDSKAIKENRVRKKKIFFEKKFRQFDAILNVNRRLLECNHCPAREL